jgi:hypothetical protein
MSLPAWHDTQGWAALLAATPSAEARAALLRERCLAAGAVPARFDNGTDLRLDLPVPGLTIEALVGLPRQTTETGVPLMAFSVPEGSEV